MAAAAAAPSARAIHATVPVLASLDIAKTEDFYTARLGFATLGGTARTT